MRVHTTFAFVCDFLPWVFLHSRVTGPCPVTADARDYTSYCENNNNNNINI